MTTAWILRMLKRHIAVYEKKISEAQAEEKADLLFACLASKGALELVYQEIMEQL